MPLHPEIEQFLAGAAAAGRPRLYELTPEQARRQASAGAAAAGAGPAVSVVEDLVIGVEGAALAARRYEPEHARGTIVWFHGGGWVLGGIDTIDAMCRVLVNSSGARLLSIGYRLAPEHPFPTPLEDCWGALSWAGRQFSGPLLVGGDSAGGNLAAVCALRARDRGGPALARQILVYPVTDHAMGTPSFAAYGGDEQPLSRRELEWIWGHYVADPRVRENPEVSPLRADDLAGLPPALVVVAGCDPLRDDGLSYAQRLREGGVDVIVHRHDGMIHSFFSMVNVLESGRAAVEAAGADIREWLLASAGE